MLDEIASIVRECETLGDVDVTSTSLGDHKTLVLKRKYEEIHVVDYGDKCLFRFVIFPVRARFRQHAASTAREAANFALLELIPLEDWVQIARLAKERIQ